MPSPTTVEIHRLGTQCHGQSAQEKINENYRREAFERMRLHKVCVQNPNFKIKF